MKRVVMLSRQFKDYITSLYDGRGDDYIAKAQGLRNDSYKDPSTFAPAPKRRGGGGFKSYSPNDEQPSSGRRRGATRKESGEEERKGKGRAKAHDSDEDEGEEEEEEEEEDEDD
jgi:hypothetical protein